MDSYIRTYQNPVVNTHVINTVNDYQMLVQSRRENVKTKFVVVHQNIRSIARNFDEFIVLLSQFREEIDCIVLSETRYISNISNFQIEGYNLLYNEGCYNVCDGVTIYIKNNINYTVKLVNLAETTALEVNIVYDNDTYQLIAIYKSPQINIADFNDSLKSYIKHIKKTDYSLIIGDVNIDILSENINSYEYLDILSENGFISQINKYTREQNESKSCLDHIFLKSKSGVSHGDVAAIIKTNITDHYTTILNIGTEKVKECINENKIYEIIDKTKLLDLIRNETWSDIYYHDNPDTSYNIFYDIIKQAIKQSTIIKMFNNKTRKRKPWITTGIIRSMNKRDQLYQKHLKNIEDNEIRNEYITYRNKINNLVKKTKNSYMKRMIYDTGKTDSKKIWEGVKNITNNQKHQSSIQYIKQGNNDIRDKQEIANIFNTYYANVGSNLAEKVDKATPSKCNILDSTIFLRPTDESEIKKYIFELKNKKAPGEDGISSETIKYISDFILTPLNFIYNKVLEKGIYPNKLKIAVIKPLFKKGERNNTENYRPLSLISNFSKILEKIIKSRLTKYLQKFDIIARNQYGFQEHKSTNDAIAKLTSLMYNALDKSKPSLVIFLDLAKAFDTVSHGQLLKNLYNIGCRGVVQKLFASYLNDRNQCVQIDNKKSEYISVKFGVPQGTVLGPVLFTIYMNDILTKNTVGKIVSFADDTAIHYSSENWASLKLIAEQDLKQIKTYFDSKILTINYEKTFFLPITSLSCNLPSYTELIIKTQSKDVLIRMAEKVKYLGIIIDSHLRWNYQVQSVVQKIRGMLYTFTQLKKVLHVEHLRAVYIALVESIIRYGIIGWGGVGNTFLHPLEVQQKHFIKLIYNRERRYSTELLFKESNLFSIRQLYCYTALIKQHKDREIDRIINHNYDTRTKEQGKFKTERKIKTIGQKYFEYIGLRLYNALPTEIRHVLYIKFFKKTVKDWIKNQGLHICDPIFN